MRMESLLTVCGLAMLSAGAFAQESSKVSGGGIEITELVESVARRTGRQFVLDPRVRAQTPLIGIKPGEVTYDQLLAILSVNMLVVVESGGIIAVVPDTNARQLPAPVYTDVNFKAPDYEVVNLLVSPKKVCANFLVPVLRPLMPQAAHLAAEIQTNTLIINDRADNARRIAEMVDTLDKRGTGVKDCQPREAVSQPPAKPKD